MDSNSIIGIGDKVRDCAVRPITRQFGYLISYGDNLKQLKDEFDTLEAERKSLQLLVEDARRKGDEILPKIQLWLDRADEIKNTVEAFYEEEGQANTECSWGACPNPSSRYRLSKKAKMMLTPQIFQLKGGGNFNPISCPKPPVAKWRGSSSTSFSKGNGAFRSRISPMNMIMDALADPAINKIGLYGPGGVGKTTLAHDAARRAEEEKFTVAMADATQKPDYKKIQKEIGDMVSFEFHEESELIRAGRPCERLKQEKNLFVIIDNLWERLDLDKIGIPSSSAQGKDKKVIQLTNDYKGCKLFLISRNLEVLSNKMKCKKIIQLDALSDNEAIELFNWMAEIQVDSDPDLLSTATDVARECAGLPLAIVTVASALRKKSLSEWKNALRQLKNPTLRDVTGLTTQIYAPIKLSYDSLETHELKLIFLLSSILYNDLLTRDLFKYCIGLGIFDSTCTLEDARDDLHTLVNKLKASCLFLDSSSGDRFMMHDLVRGVGLSILSNENHAFSVRYKKLNGWPGKDQLENYKWMCFLACDLGMLPEKLSCPRLKFFLLENKDNDMRIPDGFFEELHGLRVMDLTRVNLSFLPNSIVHLTDLTTLCLDQCVLGDISMIGELKNLRALSLIGSSIQRLPCELGKLTQLQLIDLSRCSKLKVIPPNVMSKLEKLEEMYLESSLNQWQQKESNDESSANANLSALMSLPNLSNLHIHILRDSMLRKDMFSDKLRKYRILIGDVWEWSGKYETSRTLKLKLNASIDSEMFGVKTLMDRVEDLFLDEVNGVKSVLYELNRSGFPHLKHLQIQNNSQIECIINLNKVRGQVAFPNIETLVLKNMTQLEKLCDRQLPVNSFCKLAVIKVQNCDKLNSLFPVSIVRSLPKLVEIEICECKLMQEIVDLSLDQEIDDDEDILECNQLRILTISSLPALVGFCSYDKRSLAMALGKGKQFENASNSNVITKEDKPNPSQHLFSKKVAFPSLDTLKLSALNFQNIWHDSMSANYWENLTDLSVEGCQSLRHIMPAAVAASFVKLKRLNICRCDMVETIIVPNATHTSFSEEVIFPSLETMVISHMDNLQIIWSNQFALNSYGNIKKLEISYCEKLITIIPTYILNSLCNLEELDARNCNSIEAVFDLQDIEESHALPQLQLRSMILKHLPKLKCVWNKDPQEINFCQHLQKLEAFECKSLRSIFPASIAKQIPKLEVLDIGCCDGVEVIVEKDEVARAAPCFVFPQLYMLILWKLPKLKNFYPEKHTSKWPPLKQLNVYRCIKLKVFGSELPGMPLNPENDGYQTRHPLCLIEEVIPKLQEVVIDQKAVTRITNGQFQDDLFHNVEVLYLESFLVDDVPFPYRFLERFPSLRELHVYTSWFVELFPRQAPLGVHTGKIAPFKNLTLSFLKKLKNICNEDHQSEQVLQNLESLKVTDCAALITLTPSSASFDNLTDLEVFCCAQLMYLITSSTAKSLVHLMRLKINECKMMHEIVRVEEENGGNTIAIQRLEYLELTGLQSLKAFCSYYDYTLVFPSLYQVIIRQCPRLGMFCPGVLATPILEGVEVEENRVCWEGNLNETIKQLFEDKMAFGCMEKVELHEYPELVEMWEARLPVRTTFSNLKSLIIDNCHSLSCAIPSNLLYSFNYLEELDVRHCNSVEAVFDLQDTEESHALPQLQLRSMILMHLPKLKCVWNKDPQEINFCQHLQKLEAFECKSLRSIFPASIAKQIPKLEVLDIGCCDGVEVIVEKDEVARAAPCFVFPQLYMLILWKLPKLKNFYPEKHTSKWPRLKQLNVYRCIKLKVFGSELPGMPLNPENDGYQTRHPLCLIEEVVPNLEELVLNQKAVMTISNSQFQAELFYKVKLLYLESFNDGRVTFPYSFLQKFPNLNELYVTLSSFEEIFPCRELLTTKWQHMHPLKYCAFTI